MNEGCDYAVEVEPDQDCGCYGQLRTNTVEAVPVHVIAVWTSTKPRRRIPVDSTIVSIVATIVTVTGTIVGVVIANKLTYSRSSREKLWELRRPAYGQILSELAVVERVCDDANEYISERDFHEYYASKAFNHHTEELFQHMAAIKKRFSDDYLILSDDFIVIYNELTNEMRSDPYNGSPDEAHETFTAALRKHRPRLVTLARSEMAIRSGWWPPSSPRLKKYAAKN